MGAIGKVRFIKIKLADPLINYIRDRVSGEFKLPSLAQLIEEKSHGNFVSP